MNIAYFITHHGFGHATRAAAVMESLLQRCPEARFELFTTCPQQIFQKAVGDHFGYHHVQVDIGVIQRSPLKADLTATCDQLDRMLPFDDAWVRDLAAQVNHLNCHMVICDIAPLGIAAAQAAGLPSVLIENFTWDWLYNRYAEQRQRLKPHIEYLADMVGRADHHIQTPPICHPSKSAVVMAPISRKPRSNRLLVRKQLGVAEKERMVLISMGGVPDRFEFLSRLQKDLNCYLVVPGAEAMAAPHNNVIILPRHSSFLHPDLMVAADALVGKAGYSTVAEAYQSGIPFGYIKRPKSPESTVLEKFIQRHMPSMAIATGTYATGEWLACLPKLLSIPRGSLGRENGADAVANYILSTIAPKA